MSERISFLEARVDNVEENTQRRLSDFRVELDVKLSGLRDEMREGFEKAAAEVRRESMETLKFMRALKNDILNALDNRVAKSHEEDVHAKPTPPAHPAPTPPMFHKET